MAAPKPGPTWARAPTQWGAQINYDLWNDRYTLDEEVALHHGGSADYRAGRAPYSIGEEQAQLRGWERYHLGKGWRGLAYGWGLGQTGTVYRIRGWNTYGAHTGDRDGDGIANNAEIIPVIFIGSGNHHELSAEARFSLMRLRSYFEAELGRTMRLFGHQELRGTVTSCPGPKLMAYVRDHRILTLEEFNMDEPTLRAIVRGEIERALEIESSTDLTDYTYQHSGVVMNSVWRPRSGGPSTTTRYADLIKGTYSRAAAILSTVRDIDTDVDLDEAEIARLILEGLPSEILEDVPTMVADEFDRRTRERYSQ